jgi:hypothetical protein
MALEERPHLVAALQAVLGIGEEVGPRLIERGTMPDRDQHVMQLSPFRHVIVDFVGGHDRRVAPLGHFDPALEDPGVVRAEVMVELAENAVPAQRLLQRAQPRLLVRGAEVEEVAAVLGHRGESRACLSLGLILVRDAQQPAEVGVAAEVACDQHHFFAFDLEGGADQWLDAHLAARLQKTNRAVHAAAVGDGGGRHLQLRRAQSQLVGMRAAVEEREVGVAVQLDVRRHCLARGAVVRA